LHSHTQEVRIDACFQVRTNCLESGSSQAMPRRKRAHERFVQEYVANGQNGKEERAEVTLENLIKEAGDIQRAALDAKSYAVAISALTAKAKLSGLWVERAQGENTNVNYAVSDQPPSEEEWERQHVTAN
jgi:hypothetical protein